MKSHPSVPVFACVAVGLGVFGCVPSDGALPGTASRGPIVGGTTYSGHQGVGALVIDMPGYEIDSFCTGSLITDEWVVTAAHCLLPTDEGFEPEPYMVSFFVGTDVSGSGSLYEADSFHPHGSYSSSTQANDIGLVHLRERAIGVETYSTLADPSETGTTAVRWVGFGASGFDHAGNPTGSGVKRTGTGHISSIRPLYYEYAYETAMPCSGDSGGATFQTVDGDDFLVGIISSGDETCSSYGVDTKIIAHFDWIQDVMAGGGGGTSCEITGGDCGSQACYWVGEDEFVCMPSNNIAVGSSCNPEDLENLQCVDGALCVPLSESDPTEGECFSFCRNDAHCPGEQTCELEIFEDDPTLGVCFDAPTECDMVGGDCPAGEACYPVIDGGSYCFPSSGAGLGDGCNASQLDPLPCGDGLICFPFRTGGQCVEMCRSSADCVEGECQRVGSVFDGVSDVGYCVACTDADGDGECAPADCNDGDPNVHHGAPEPCGDGVDNDCDGQIDETCDCTDGDSDGFCVEDDCDDGNPGANPAASEICNDGFDNNCDGAVDGADVFCGGMPPDGGVDGGVDGGGGDDDDDGGRCRCAASGRARADAPAAGLLLLLGLALRRRLR